MLAPNAEEHLTVALMSSEITLQQIFVSLSARAAQISCLCAKDFDMPVRFLLLKAGL